MTVTPPLGPAHALRGGGEGPVHALPGLRGFGGLHGGLAVAMAVQRSRSTQGATGPVKGVTARFHRPVEGTVSIAAETTRRGRSVQAVRFEVRGERGICIDGSLAVGHEPDGAAWPAVAPPMPDVPPPAACPVFAVPPEFVPIAAFTEVRPVGPHRPYVGGPVPELTAWVRMTEDDRPPDTARLVFLLDALAPSYAAILDTMVLVPTVEMVVRPSADAPSGGSPWVLLHARTTRATAGGWCDEHIDAWSEDGAHLGGAEQLRVVRPEPAAPATAGPEPSGG